MPFQVFENDIGAKQVYGGALGIKRRYNVPMTGFAVAHHTNEATALGTTGAGPCMIIVVHKADGWGALGHHADHGGNPVNVADAVKFMVEKLEGGPIAAIVLAAGYCEAGPQQSSFEQTIVASVRSNHPGAQVTWAKPSQGADEEAWSSCFYLPQAGQIGLFGDFSETPFSGPLGKAVEGITPYAYPNF